MQSKNSYVYPAIYAAIMAGKAILEVYGTRDFEVENKADHSPLTLADRKAHETIVELLKNTGLPVLSEEGKQISYEHRKHWNHFWMVDPLDGTKEFIKRNGEFTVNIAMIENQSPVLGVIYVPVTGVLYLGEVGVGASIFDSVDAVESMEDVLSLEGEQLPRIHQKEYYGVVASRSHLNKETSDFLEEISANNPTVKVVSRGSSLKLCMIAEGEAEVYPRFAPTMEWDTAAGHAICKAAGARVYQADNVYEELLYNKEDLLNPWFIARW
jgi:3'(2'), 5'-bisphosphate nucleotidase